MIAYLNGVIAVKELDSAVLDVQGVGYGVVLSGNDNANLTLNQTVKLFIYEHIRDDAHDLYGFSRVDSKRLFEQLLSVKNVGPKVALAVLSIGSEDAVRLAIANGDVKLLQTAKGVGKRAAEQMVVELRDKVGLVASSDAEGIVTRGGVNLADEAVQALIALGYSEFDAQKALEQIDAALPTEERIRQALRGTN
ncbi:MAG: Holliday junction branch migration protein RuvA [Candidatus Saccharimonadales bacterium]